MLQTAQTLAPVQGQDQSWTVRHFQIDLLGFSPSGIWTIYDATDTRDLPTSRQTDKLRTYALRQIGDNAWEVMNKTSRTVYTVHRVEDYLTCDCPAGVRPPRHTTTSVVDPQHGSCVHRDVLAAHLAIEAAEATPPTCQQCGAPLKPGEHTPCWVCHHGAATAREWDTYFDLPALVPAN